MKTQWLVWVAMSLAAGIGMTFTGMAYVDAKIEKVRQDTITTREGDDIKKSLRRIERKLEHLIRDFAKP